MFRKYLLPLLALSGVVFAAYTVINGDRNPAPAPAQSPASHSPYASFVAGSGIVEANTENIFIGTPTAGIVSQIFVHIGSTVKAGDPLFGLDDRALHAQLLTRQAAVKVAETELANINYDLTVAEGLVTTGASPTADREKQRYLVNIAEAQLALARAESDSAQTDLQRLTVRAPVDGQVLQLKVHLGEFASAAPSTAGEPPLILLGGTTPLHVRVNVDENDAWKVQTGASATAFLRGHPEVHASLKFVRIEPYVVPKKSLTGDSTERVDTRVLQVIFSFNRGDLPIYVGQQMDVFIEGSRRPTTDTAPQS